MKFTVSSDAITYIRQKGGCATVALEKRTTAFN